MQAKEKNPNKAVTVEITKYPLIVSTDRGIDKPIFIASSGPN